MTEALALLAGIGIGAVAGLLYGQRHGLAFASKQLDMAAVSAAKMADAVFTPRPVVVMPTDEQDLYADLSTDVERVPDWMVEEDDVRTNT